MSHAAILPDDPTELDLTYDVTPQPYYTVMLAYCALLAKTERNDWATGTQKLGELSEAQQELAELLLTSELYQLAGVAIPQTQRRLVCQRFIKYLKIIAGRLQHLHHREQITATIDWFEGYAKGSTDIFPAPEPVAKRILSFTSYLVDKPLARWYFGEKTWLELNPDFDRQRHQLLEAMMLRRLERQILHVELAILERRDTCEYLRRNIVQLLAYRVRNPIHHTAYKEIINWLKRYRDNQLMFQPSIV